MAVNVAYIMNLFIPKSGEISRAVIINKYENVPFDKAFGTIISERAVDVIILLGFTAIAFFLQFDTLFNFLSETIEPSKFYIAFGILFIVGIVFLLFINYSKSLLQQKIKQFYLGIKEGVMSILVMKKKKILYSI